MEATKWECEALNTGGDIFLMHSGLGDTVKPMYHDYVLVCYAVFGECVHHIANKQIPVSEGDIFIVNPNTVHYFSRTKRVQFPELYYCMISEKKVKEIYKEIKNDFPELKSFFDNSFINYIYAKDNANKEIRGLFVRMLDEFMTSPPGGKMLVGSYLTITLTKILRRYLQAMNNPVFNRNKTVDQVIRYINYNLNYGVTLHDIADAFHLSEEYLCRLFKRHTGTTIKQFILNLRIEKIKDLLQNTDRSIESIAVSLGCGQEYLSRLFKKHTGMSLLEYRKKYHYKA